ncbi:error-prone DNA polymerase [Filimonas effusa]|uniref:DNA polymerase III subunit alpha n=1 Tax=Filimonas effusa TaxID=2508721 RepID=A0A4V1MAI0_9BACT|nr:error-prone DNA polymerase [Filimonas effusa]RXK85946.1 DNA polymerase III subunit alpha [Filimonas effusa]
MPTEPNITEHITINDTHTAIQPEQKQPYAELQVTTNFSFLRGASHPAELVEQAKNLGYTKIAITDRNTLAGVVRAHAAAREHGITIIPACRLDLLDGPSLLAYPTCKTAYESLSTLLTKGNLRTGKGQCELYKADAFQHAKGLKWIILPPGSLTASFEWDPIFLAQLKEYKTTFGNDLYLAATRFYNDDDLKKLHRLSLLSQEFNIPLVATNDVYYHIPDRRQLQDIVTCIREKCTIGKAGFRLQQNAERYLKPAEEMNRLFRHYPQAITNATAIANACNFSLDSLKYVYPEELTTEGRTPQQELTFLAWQGAREKFGEHIPEKISSAINYELRFMEEMNYASYFLTVYDIVRFARKQNILCQGRGSAANSTVCYCLGITAVNPDKFDLLFERFISSARNEPPDIDVDFEHERREEVMQYIYQKYGRDRAAIVATVTQQHSKGAIRDVGKAMGLSVDVINRISRALGELRDDEFDEKRMREHGLDINDPYLKKVLSLTQQFKGFPRQLGQHTGGFVITQGKLSDLCPILNARMENRTCIEWNKDDIDTLGFLKIDVLALGMLTCMRKAFDLMANHHHKKYTLDTIPGEDPKVYEMISNADTIGVFQIESRAQQSMLPRLRPQEFYDLVIEVAIVRPGPIQGNMVHPYLKRRNKEETVSYPSEELREILHKTLGVPLFQEQAMKIAIVAAGFSPAEADALRRSMATFKTEGMVAKFRKKLVDGMRSKGYEEEYALRIFRQLEGFGSYGFPESHAASFALLVYASSWIKYYYPDVFACSLLNSMPMGFYQPAQIITDARKHGVTVLPVDVNHSSWDNTLEEKQGDYCALRLGFRQVKGLRQEEMQLLASARSQMKEKAVAFTTITTLHAAGISQSALECLAGADAFTSLGLNRRQALWEVSALHDHPTGVFTGQPSESETEQKVPLPILTPAEHVLLDYNAIDLSLKGHPVQFVRPQLQMLQVTPTANLAKMKDGDYVKVAGLILVRQRPGTAKNVCFITIEDETGNSNLVVFEERFICYRREILQSKLLMVEGKLQREGDVIHVVVEACYNLSQLLHKLAAPTLPATINKRAQSQTRPEESKLPASRDFK